MRRLVFISVVVTPFFSCGGPTADAPCVQAGDTWTCPHSILTLTIEGAAAGRVAHFKAPAGKVVPATGWPVAVLFQGAYVPASWFWGAAKGTPFGAEFQTGTVRALLDAGFLVLTPEAQGGGAGVWDTNVVPWNIGWEGSPDHAFMLALLKALDDGKFGTVDKTRRFAGGISSGGYMTSRMALSYPGKFRALAIQSASYALCLGPLCAVPDPVSLDHPPTIFLHGEKDEIVPIDTMKPYATQLEKQSIEVVRVTSPGAGHEWLAESPAAIAAFFTAH